MGSKVILRTERWHDFLSRESRGLPIAEASDEVAERFCDEVFARIYSGDETIPFTETPDRRFAKWALAYHRALSNSPAFARLVAQAKGSALKSAIAIDAILSQVRPEPEPEEPGGGGEGGEGEEEGPEGEPGEPGGGSGEGKAREPRQGEDPGEDEGTGGGSGQPGERKPKSKPPKGGGENEPGENEEGEEESPESGEGGGEGEGEESEEEGEEGSGGESGEEGEEEEGESAGGEGEEGEEEEGDEEGEGSEPEQGEGDIEEPGAGEGEGGEDEENESGENESESGESGSDSHDLGETPDPTPREGGEGSDEPQNAGGERSGYGTGPGGTTSGHLDLSDLPEIDESSLENKLVGAVEEAEKEMDNVEEALRGLAGAGVRTDPNGDVLPADVAAARSMAKSLKMNPSLKRIVDLAGRFKAVAARKRESRTPHGNEVMLGIERGTAIDKLLPAELARLGDNELSDSFYHDFAESRTLQYQKESKVRQGHGPIVMVLDKSSSMFGPPDEWQAAICLAMLEHAKRQRRTFAVIGFAGSVLYTRKVKPSEPLPIESVTRRASGGSTNIEAALKHALAVIEEEKRKGGKLGQADVILITDGQSYTGNALEVRAMAEKLDVSIIALGIGVRPEALAPWTNDVRAVESLSEINDAMATALFAPRKIEEPKPKKAKGAK